MLHFSGSFLGVIPGFTEATHSIKAIAAASTAVLPDNVLRLYASFRNDSDEDIYLFFGPTATTAGIKLDKNGGFYEITASNLYLGVITAIHAGAGNKNLRVLEGK